jgi:pyridoxal phosphate-dependent aminotransferase EpsN
MADEKKRIYLSSPHMSGLEQLYIEEAFTENWIAPLGPHVDAFEQELADYLRVKAAAVLSSGTAALHLALILFGVRKGDPVFCSTLTFAATANPIIYLGAKPVFIDSEPESWNMSPQALKRALAEAESEGSLPKAVIVVNLYGQSADYDPIIEICKSYSVSIIEDAAESLGATYKGKMSGSFGKISILSFNGNKIITTSGGGALVSNDPEAVNKARYLATQARQPARHYEHTEAGYNYRMSNVLAGIGRGQLEVLEERVEARRAVCERYRAAFNDLVGFYFMPEAGFGRSTRWLTVLTVDPDLCGVSRDDIIDVLEAENIEARPVWKPMHLQPLYQGCRYYTHELGSPSPQPSPLKGEGVKEPTLFKGEGEESPNIIKDNCDIGHFLNHHCSISDRLFELGLCLPSGSNLTLEEQARVINLIKQAITKG